MQKQLQIFLILMISLSAKQFAISQNYGTLNKGHSHNDYLQKRPLYDALELGFSSIEIDVYVKNNELIVSHLPIFLHQKPKIETLYFEPLKTLMNDSQFIRSFQNHPLILMIDIKNESEKSLELLRKKVKIIQKYLQYPGHHKGDNRILQICLSGKKPMSAIMSDSSKFYTLDGSISGDLSSDLPQNLLQRLSDPVKKHFKSKKNLKKDEVITLQQLVWKAHAKGRQIRFYAAGNNPKLWEQLHYADVDWINVDKLKDYAKFVQSENKKPD